MTRIREMDSNAKAFWYTNKLVWNIAVKFALNASEFSSENFRIKKIQYGNHVQYQNIHCTWLELVEYYKKDKLPKNN